MMKRFDHLSGCVCVCEREREREKERVCDLSCAFV